MNEQTSLELAQLVREACVRAALEAYEDAGISGLCQEGRWEVAVGAMRSLDVKQLVTTYQRRKAT